MQSLSFGRQYTIIFYRKNWFWYFVISFLCCLPCPCLFDCILLLDSLHSVFRTVLHLVLFLSFCCFVLVWFDGDGGTTDFTSFLKIVDIFFFLKWNLFKIFVVQMILHIKTLKITIQLTIDNSTENITISERLFNLFF